MMSLGQWFQWRTLRAEGQTNRQKDLEIQWWPLLRFGRYPRWGIWIVRYENPKEDR